MANRIVHPTCLAAPRQSARAVALLAIVAIGLGTDVVAQDHPLSAIDWLSRTTSHPATQSERTGPIPLRGNGQTPAIVQPDPVPAVETAALGAPDRAAVGLLAPARVGLPADLWHRSSAKDLIALIEDLDLAVPSMARLMQMLMLAEATGPNGDSAGFLAIRLEQLIGMGAVDSAQAMLERAGLADPAIFAQWSELALLSGHGTQMCRSLMDQPALSQDQVLKVYCIAQSGDWARAATVLQTSVTLGDIRPRQARLMAQFLDPDLAESQPVPLPPVRPSALTYRIYEAIGDPLPSLSLPLPFATLDLSGDNGWKPQLEAAERLARSGALPPNRLLGLYSLRHPAASGGIWDRVDAFQRFETALQTGPDSRLQSRLETVWPQMTAAGLTLAFAELFAAKLDKASFSGRAQRIQQRMMFLSPDYETLGPEHAPDTAEGRFLTAIAKGTAPQRPYPPLPHAASIAAAFDDHPAPDAVIGLVRDGKTGEAILQAMALFSAGAEGQIQRVA